MIKTVTYSKQGILDYVKNIDIANTPDYFISVSTSHGPESFRLFEGAYHNVISLFFDDVEVDCWKDIEDGRRVWCNAMTEQQATELLSFINSIPNDTTVHINCSEGQSRSPAIAQFINEHRNNVKENNPLVNQHVLKLLQEATGYKRYIEKHDEVKLGWKIKKWFPVDINKIQNWYYSLEERYSDWKFIVGENHHIWKFPITDPEGKTGHRLMDDTAYYTLCWNSDEPGPKPFEQGCAKDEYKDNDDDNLNPRMCFDGYALDIVQGLPVRSKKWLVTIHTPGTKLITHQDAPDKIRVHIPIHTNNNSNWIIDGEEYHMEPGWAYLVNTTVPHSVENKGSTDRIHLYGKVWTEDVRKLNL